MHCPAPICSDLSHLFSGCNSLYSVTVFPKQGKMEQVTEGCSSKMVVRILVFYYHQIMIFPLNIPLISGSKTVMKDSLHKFCHCFPTVRFDKYVDAVQILKHPRLYILWGHTHFLKFLIGTDGFGKRTWSMKSIMLAGKSGIALLVRFSNLQIFVLGFCSVSKNIDSRITFGQSLWLRMWTSKIFNIIILRPQLISKRHCDFLNVFHLVFDIIYNHRTAPSKVQLFKYHYSMRASNYHRKNALQPQSAFPVL